MMWDLVSFGGFEDVHLLSSSFNNAIGQVLVHFIVRVFQSAAERKNLLAILVS